MTAKIAHPIDAAAAPNRTRLQVYDQYIAMLEAIQKSGSANSLDRDLLAGWRAARADYLASLPAQPGRLRRVG